MNMTLINVHVKDDEKKKIQQFVDKNTTTSMSDFVRSVIAERIQLDELIQKLPEPVDVDIPEYIPKNKYVVFVNGAVIAVGDSPSELATIALKKFPDFPLVIKYNGPKQAPLEYVYMSLSEWHAWKYAKFQEKTYPMLLIDAEAFQERHELTASIDTAASLCVLKEGIFNIRSLKSTHSESIATAAGIIKCPIYAFTVHILDVSFDIDFILAPISDALPFNFLLGRNLMDKLDAYFFGKKQVFMLKIAN
jgi:hypothetical protein